MVDIVTNPEWKAVRILERDEVALGGYGGNMNEQATALVARTEMLMQEQAKVSIVSLRWSSLTPRRQLFQRIVSSLLMKLELIKVQTLGTEQP